MKLQSNQLAISNKRDRSMTLTPRGVLLVLFRRRRLLTLSFIGTLAAIVLALLLMSSSYEAEVKFLVERQRVDPLVTAEQQNASGGSARKVTEDELNSEVELLSSRDLLEKVVIACQLYQPKNPWSLAGIKLRTLSLIHLAPDEKTRIYNSVLNLEQQLQVTVLPNSDMIKVLYDSSSPSTAANVLQKLSTFYIEKHADVHRPSGTYDFFKQQTKAYEKALADAQVQLVQFNRKKGIVSADAEKQMIMQKMSDFDTSLRQTRALLAETQKRVGSLATVAGSTASRVTTQVRTSADSQLLSNLNTTLVNLELQRSQLLQKFKPGYRLVKDIDAQIAQAKSAIADAEKASIKEETTDRDPTYDWARTELAKADAEVLGLQARASVTEETINKYKHRALELDQEGTTQQRLMQAVKSAQDNYSLFHQKEEEAAVSEALDQKRILNVMVAEPAMTPLQPSGPGLPLKLLLGVVLAGMVTVGIAFGSDYLDPSFRTPAEVETELRIPVLASVPYLLDGNTHNGNGLGNGNSSFGEGNSEGTPLHVIPAE